MRQKQLNFVDAYIESLGIKQERQKRLRRACVIGIIVLLIFSLVSVFAIKYLEVRREYRELNAYLESPTVQRQIEEYDEITAELTASRNNLSYITSLRETLAGYPYLDETMLDDIYRLAGDISMVETTFDRASGMLAIGCESALSTDPSEFTKDLRATDYFHYVTYDGYEYDKVGEVYTYTIVCLVKVVDAVE